MSSTTVFKRLFEVQILHDYFLTTIDGTSFFDKNKADKLDLISKKLQLGSYNILDFFEIEPQGVTKKVLNDYKLVTAQTPLGFVVGIEVDVVSESGETLFRPRLKFKTNLNLTFSLRPKASFFKSITNISLRPPLPLKYYFTNKDKKEFEENSSPPYKSLPISDKVGRFQKNKGYEMGALANFRGKIKEALQYTLVSNVKFWEEIDDKSFVNDADRTLLPHRFTYQVKKPEDITEIKFVLADKSGNEIKVINKTGEEAKRNINIDFTRVDENDEDSAVIASGFYNLKINVNDTSDVKYSVYLNDELYNNDDFATIDIRFDEENSPFSLLDSEGFLTTRVSTSGEKIPHPIFEIRFKNRRTYWRYNKEGDFTPAEITATSVHLEHQPKQLVSLKPKALTSVLVPFMNGTSLMLPHPRMPSIKVEQDRIFSEIFINQSNRLLNN